MAYQIGDTQGAVVGATMLLTSLSLSPPRGRAAVPRPAQHHLRPRRLPGIAQLRRYGIALLAIVADHDLDILQRIFGTTDAELRPVGDLRRPRASASSLVDEVDQARSPSATATRHPAAGYWKETPMPFNLRNRSFLKELDFTPAELRHLLRLPPT